MRHDENMSHDDNPKAPPSAIELAQLIKDWWQDNCTETVGEYGEYNRYRTDPPFVQAAKELLGDWER
jgi:hypothetical protein